jgi:hypothetical protein
MKIFICCSKHFYSQIPPVKEALEKAGHEITLPNSYDNPGREDEMRNIGAQDHAKWKAEMLREQERKVKANDAVVVLNFDKNGLSNYIGGATFLEVFKAFEYGKKIFLYNPIPDNLLRDELLGMEPTILNGDLSLIS